MIKPNFKLAILFFGLILFSYSCSSSDDDDDDDDDDDTTEFILTSIAIDDNDELLPAFKCDDDATIPLAWSGVPSGATSLAIIMKHYPNSSDSSVVSSYLLLWGIDTSVSEISTGGAGSGSWFMGANKNGVSIGYTSPCSPSTGSHEYTITIYALSETPSSLPTESSLIVDYDTLLSAIETVTIEGQASITFDSVTN